MVNRTFKGAGAATIARATGLLLLLTLVGATVTSCGTANRTVALPETTSAVSRYAGTYAGTWVFRGGINPAEPIFGGMVTLRIATDGVVTADFTDTVGGGNGTIHAIGAVDERGAISYTPPQPILVGAPTFAGTASIGSDGKLTASGTVSYDFPGAGSWSAAAG